MKINRKFISTVLLISALLGLLTGCFVAPETPPITYTVTYNGNTNTGGTVPADANLYEEGTLVTVLANTGTLVKTGYSFDGWNTAADGNGTSYGALDTFAMGTANVMLFAQWKGNMGGVCQPCPSVPTYKVTFDKNEISATGTMADQIIPSGESANLTANAFAWADHTFVGWAETSGGAVAYLDQASITPTADVILYAKWVVNYKITFDKNEISATGTMADQIIPSGESANLTANAFAWADHTFVGWAETSGGAVAYLDQASITPTADVILYAKWVETGTVNIVISGDWWYNIKMDDVIYYSSVLPGTYVINNVSVGNHFFEEIDDWGSTWGYDSITQYINSGINWVYLDVYN